MLEYHCLTFNPFSENTYLVYDHNRDAIIIDPGCADYQERQYLKEVVQKLELNIKKLVNTHCHIDHVLGNDFVKNTYGVELHIHKNELPVLESCQVIAANYGFNAYVPAQADRFLDEGELLVFGESAMEILLVPGHAPGHLAFYHAATKVCFAGDVLFKQSIGRTDFPYCNHQQLIDSIQQKMYKLPNDTTVLPGHGPKTTIGFEKKNNPFVTELKPQA
jgi:hydroxyacylglutathione hydrolase